jgi:hypothetical protein
MTPAYIPPGVSVDELLSPSITSNLSTTTTVGIVALSAGAITRTDLVTLSGTTAVVLPSIPTDATMATVVSVKDADPTKAPGSYNVNTGYTVTTTTPTNADQAVVSLTSHTVARNGTATTPIPDGNSVYITYTYTTSDYWAPIRLDNMSDIQDRFGAAWDSTGTSINSILSHAAQIAFENGASDLVLQPLFFNNTGVKQQPTSPQAAASATWADNFTSLREIDDINVIVPVVGQSAANMSDSTQLQIIQTAQDHVNYMLQQDQYVVALAGEDSSASSSNAQQATIQSHAATLQARYGGTLNEQMVLVNTSKFIRSQPGSFGGVFYVGGQYVAAALAGMLAARSVSQSLTRKVVSGFTGVADNRTKTQKNADAAAGLLVVEQKTTLVQVRHGVTLDTTSTARRELSVVRAKYSMIESLRDTLDQLIGQVIADGTAASVVASAVQNVLEGLKNAGDIVDYANIQARTTSLDPTIIEVRFSYRPAFPINYINIVFSLDLSSQELTLPTTGATNNFGV